MKELLRSDYNYMLYQDGPRLLLSVACGTVAVFDITIALTAQETKYFQTQGEEFLVYLAGKVQYNPENYLERRI